MTASAAALTALGTPPVVADLIGDNISQSLAGVGTAQSGATLLTGSVNTVTTASGQTAFILKAHNAGRTVVVANTSATTALVYPPTGATIQGGAANASFSVAQNKTALFWYITPLIIVANLSA